MDVLGFEKLIYHYPKIEKIKQRKKQFPVHMTLSLGNYCNHKCLWCTAYEAQKQKAQQMDIQRLLNFLKKSRERGLLAVGYVGSGEPTAHSHFGDIVEGVNALGLEQGMFTNGYLLDRYMDQAVNFFTYIRISLDAGSAETHEIVHDVKGHFDRVIDNIKTLVKRRKNRMPMVGIQYVTHQINLGDLYECAKIASEIGVDYFSVKPVFNRGAVGFRLEKNSLGFEDITPVVAKAKQDFERPDFEIHHRPVQILSNEEERYIHPYARCVAASFNLNVHEDGRLVGCGPNDISIGSMEDDFDELEDRILALSDELDLSKCPAGCRYHALNHIVDTVVDPAEASRYHPNFI